MEQYKSTSPWSDIPNIYSIIEQVELPSSILLGTSSVSQLTPNLTPTSADKELFTWESSDETVATVDQSGKVTGHSIGTAIITVNSTEDPSVSASCTVGVLSLTLSSDISVTVTQSSQIGTSIVPSAFSGRSITWKSSNTNIATVDENGVVTGQKVGSTTITASLEENPEVAASCTVTVTPLKVSTMTFDKETVSVVRTEDAHLYLTLNSEKVENKTMTWTSSDENVATVAQSSTSPLEAIVKTHKVGTAIITATSTDGTNISASCTVNVTPLKVESIKFTSNNTVLRNNPTQLKVSILPEEADDQSVKWSSLNSDIATVDDNGVVTGLKRGTATIRVEATDGSGVCCDFQIAVRLVDNVSLPASLTLEKTTTQKLTAEVTPIADEIKS